MEALKMVIVGDDIPDKSGFSTIKTQLLVTYATNAPPGDYTPTVFDNYSANVVVDGQAISLGLWDTSGQVDHDRMRSLSYAGSGIFGILFSVINPESYENVINTWYPEVAHHCPGVPIVLIGCNTSMRNKPKIVQKLKEKNMTPITIEQGEQMARKIGAVAYRECDYFCMIGIREAFYTGIRAGLNYTSSFVSKKKARSPKYPLVCELYNQWIEEANSTNNLEQLCALRDSIDSSNSTLLDLNKPINAAIEKQVTLATKGLTLQGCQLETLPPHFISKFQKLEILNLRQNKLHQDFNYSSSWKLQALDLSRNQFTTFPINLKDFPFLSYLSLARNLLEELPEHIAEFPQLQLDVSHNKITSLAAPLLSMNLDVTGNPLEGVIPAYRNDKDKLLMYLKNIQIESTVEWKQVKLMLFGQEEVGKTTLLRALRKEKINPAVNISTNGVDIVPLNLEYTPPSPLLGKLLKKPQTQQVQCNVWDFGGQAVFHSTHRLFITPSAIYVVLYDLSKPDTHERVRYWLDQIEAVQDIEGTKPIVIVGTHADRVSKAEQTSIMQKMETLYPKSKRSQIQGHFSVSLLSDKASITELTCKLVDLALNHPKIGVGQVRVPQSVELLSKKFEELKVATPYLKWAEYVNLCKEIGISEMYIQDNTTILHDLGAIVWHNVPKLRDVVIVNPQWLAHTMSGVVSFISHASVAKDGGMVSWKKIKESLKLRFPESVHLTAISMLEFFEIVYKMKIGHSLLVSQNNADSITDEQMFFVPSLLSSFNEKTDHPALLRWNSIETSHTFVRHFSWSFFPAGFFPRLLLRLVHLRVRPLAYWLDAAIIMDKDGGESALLKISHEAPDKPYILEVKVKSEEVKDETLVAELAYAISRLHRDMYIHQRSNDIPLVHQIILSNNLTVSFETCVKAEIEGKPFITVGGQPQRLHQFFPDMNACKQIPDGALQIEKQIGEGGFGVVYKGLLKSQDVDGSTISTVVAIKEIRQSEEANAFDDFQHEVTIMSKLNHVNLVNLYGITKSPLRMVLEFIPKSDLHNVLKQRTSLSLKLKLKIAIDCASGVRYLHSQSPAICHSDLRAPNVFIASLDETANVVAKVADFGLSQHVFPFSQQTLHNTLETAPETWEGGLYDEKSDVFSFAMILWRLFATKFQNEDNYIPQGDGDAEDIDETDFEYLKENGRFFPPPKQREAIRQGGRPPIYSKCADSLKELIQDCWQLLPESRPSFHLILKRLLLIYTSFFSEDDYLQVKQKELEFEDFTMDQFRASENSFQQSLFHAKNWAHVSVNEFSGTVATILELPMEMWVGTSTGCLGMFDKQSSQFIQSKNLQSSNTTNAHLPTKRAALLAVGGNCVWVAVGAEIDIISTKTRNSITSKLSNTYAITTMVLLPSMFVWVADTEGFVSIWDAQTLQKCYRFRIHAQNCAQSMALLHTYVCMAVGRELIAVHIHTLDIIHAEPTHGDRIQQVITVPDANQVWTCTRDGFVSVWQFSFSHLPKQSESSLPLHTSKSSIDIKMVQNWQLKTPVKSACVFSDGGHVCVGTFDGSILLWNIRTFSQYEIPVPENMKGHNIPCIMDTEYGLWCGVEGIQVPLLFHKHEALLQKSTLLPCRSHGCKYHDVFLNYRVWSEGSKSLVSPVETCHRSLSIQKKKKSIGDVTVFWDEKCLNYGQNWERSFFHALTTSKVVILLVSAKTLEGIKNTAAKQQDNVLVEYECAIMQNKLKKTPVIPIFIAEAQKGNANEINFTPFDFKELDPALFPNEKHKRGGDIQYIVKEMSKSLPSNDQKFLKSISATIDQLRKLQGYKLDKRGTDELELQTIVDQVMIELEKI